MRAEDHIDPRVRQKLREALLLLIGFEEVLGSPVHGRQHHVGRLPRPCDVGDDALVVDEVDGVGRQVCLREAVDAVGVVEQGERDAIAFDEGQLVCLLLACRRAREHDGHAVPYRARVLDGAEGAPVVGVVGRRGYKVEPRCHYGVGHLVDGVEGGPAVARRGAQGATARSRPSAASRVSPQARC